MCSPAGEFYSLTPTVEAVETEGLLYPLHSEALYQRAPRGVGNELLGHRGLVHHGRGRLLVVIYRKEATDER